jgi:hypothetical protein
MVSEEVKIMHDTEGTENCTDDRKHVSEGRVTDCRKKRELMQKRTGSDGTFRDQKVKYHEICRKKVLQICEKCQFQCMSYRTSDAGK